MTYPLYFAWENNPRRAELFKRRCRVIARGTMNSVLIEFESGERVVTSRYAARKPHSPKPPTGLSPEHIPAIVC